MGLYRVSGCDKTVRELKEKFLRGKNVPLLSKVDDIHAICGLLKDFLRSLKEPLLTFRLNKTFMEAAGKELLSCWVNWETSVLSGALVLMTVLICNMLGRSLFCCTENKF